MSSYTECPTGINLIDSIIIGIDIRVRLQGLLQTAANRRSLRPPADGRVVVTNTVLEQSSGAIPEAARESPGVVDARLLLPTVDIAQRIIPIRVHRVATAIGHLYNRAFPVEEVIVFAPV